MHRPERAPTHKTTGTLFKGWRLKRTFRIFSRTLITLRVLNTTPKAAELLGKCDGELWWTREIRIALEKESQAIIHDHAISPEKPSLNGAKMNIIQENTLLSNPPE